MKLAVTLVVCLCIVVVAMSTGPTSFSLLKKGTGCGWDVVTLVSVKLLWGSLANVVVLTCLLCMRLTLARMSLLINARILLGVFVDCSVRRVIDTMVLSSWGRFGPGPMIIG